MQGTEKFDLKKNAKKVSKEERKAKKREMPSGTSKGGSSGREKRQVQFSSGERVKSSGSGSSGSWQKGSASSSHVPTGRESGGKAQSSSKAPRKPLKGAFKNLQAVAVSMPTSFTPKQISAILRMQQVGRRFVTRLRLSKARRMRQERTKLMFELLHTERAYMRQLRTIRQTFMEPLHYSLRSAVPIVTADEYATLFSDIEVLLFYNGSFLAALEDKMSHWHEFSDSLVDILSVIVDFAQVYVTYVNKFSNLCNLFSKLSEDPKFSRFLRSHHRVPLCATLDVMMVLPVVRIGDYIMMFKLLKTSTWNSHTEFSSLNDSLFMLEQVVPLMNLDQTAIVFKTKTPPGILQSAVRSVVPAAGKPPTKSSGPSPGSVTHRRSQEGTKEDSDPLLLPPRGGKLSHRRKRSSFSIDRPELQSVVISGLLNSALESLPLVPGSKQKILDLLATSMQPLEEVKISLSVREQLMVAALEKACASAQESLAESAKVIALQALARRHVAQAKVGQLVRESGSMQIAVKRKNGFVEILQSERDYIASLDLLIGDYLQPLTTAASSKEPAIELRDVTDLFGNIALIRDIHRTLLTELGGLVSTLPAVPSVGALFSKLVVHLKAYKDYASNFALATIALQRCKANDSFIKLANLDSNSDKTLDGLLARPLGQVANYLRAITDLQRATPSGHPDFDMMNKAVPLIAQLQAEVETSLSDGSRKSKLVETDRRIFGLPEGFNLLKSGADVLREFLGDHDAYVAEGKTGKKKTRHLFLFNDVLVIAQAADQAAEKKGSATRSVHFKSIHVVELSSAFGTKIEPTSAKNTVVLSTPEAAVQGSPAQILSFSWKSDATFKSWHALFHHAMSSPTSPLSRLPKGLPTNNLSPQKRSTVTARSPAERASVALDTGWYGGADRDLEQEAKIRGRSASAADIEDPPLQMSMMSGSQKNSSPLLSLSKTASVSLQVNFQRVEEEPESISASSD